MWDERYAEPGFAYGDAPNDFVVEQAEAIPMGRVLCLAEGEGRNAVWLAQRGYDVTAVDQSAVGLEKAETMAAERGVSIVTVVADLADYSVAPGAWNGIVSVWAHVPKTIRVPLHRACVRGLKPGGVLVLEAYSPKQVARGTGGPKDPALCMALADLREELSGLELVVAEERVREVHEGKYHDGPSDVVRVVGRKPQ